MYTLDEINVILSDLDACGHGDCRACSRADHGRANSLKRCLGLDSDAAAVIRLLLSEFHRYSVDQMQLEDEE